MRASYDDGNMDATRPLSTCGGWAQTECAMDHDALTVAGRGDGYRCEPEAFSTLR